jgi:hypothetical protein
MRHCALTLAATWLMAGAVVAEAPKIDRTIAKEPVYQSKTPKYGLLVFGPEAKGHVWLVLDGDTLYVDRNGNGDLTEAGKKVAAEKPDRQTPRENDHSFDVGELTIGGKTHKSFDINVTPISSWREQAPLRQRPEVKAALEKDPNAAVVSLSIEVEVPGLKGGADGGRVYYMAGFSDRCGVLQFANSPADAPVVWLGGPLEITFPYDLPTLRVGHDTDLVFIVGTAGIGPGTFASIGYEGTIPEEISPVAELTVPGAKPGDPPIKERTEIKCGRC